MNENLDFYGFPCPPKTITIGIRGSIPEVQAIKIMENIGITYHHFYFHHMAQVWWFVDCKNLPAELPENMPSHKSTPPLSHWEEFTTPRRIKVKMDDGNIVIGELSRESDSLIGCYSVTLNEKDKERYDPHGIGIGVGYSCQFVERVEN